MGLWSDYVYLIGRLSPLLASKTNGHAKEYNGRKVFVYVAGMGRYHRCCVMFFYIYIYIYISKHLFVQREIFFSFRDLVSYYTCIFAEAPKDLIRKLLVVDPKKRISLKEALEHSFFHTVVCIFMKN